MKNWVIFYLQKKGLKIFHSNKPRFYPYQKLSIQLVIIYSNSSFMQEHHSQTSVTLVKKNTQQSLGKSNKIQPMAEDYQPGQPQKTPSRFVIQSSKVIKRRKPLPMAIQMLANYNYGCSLKSLSIPSQSHEIVRVKSFPYSQFEIHELSDKNTVFSLVSNFLGTRYHLYEEKQLILSIVFSTGFCSNFGSRQFSMYGLTQNTKYSDLKNQCGLQDLEQLFYQPQNLEKITKLMALQPRRNIDNGELSLNFSRKHVIASVQNAILIDIVGEQAMEMVKIGSDLFEVSFQKKIPKIWGVALGLAGLDFKWALQ